MKEYFRLLSYLKPYWLRLSTAVFSIIIFALLDGASMSLAIPLLIVLFEADNPVISHRDSATGEGFFGSHEILASIQKRILAGDSLHVLQKIVVLVVFLFILKSLFDYLQRYLSRSLEQLVVRDLRNEIHDHLNGLSFKFFHKTKTGQLISCMSNDVNTVRAVLTDSFGKILMSGALVVVYVGLLFATNWKLTLMAFVLIPPMAALVSWVARKLRRKNLWLQNALGEITSIFQETVAGIRVVKAFSMEDFERRKFQAQTQEFYRQSMRTNRYASLSSPLSETLMTVVGAALLLYGGRQVLAAEMPAQDFLFFLLVSMRVMSPVKVFGNFNDILQQGLSACDRIFRILDTRPAITDPPDAVPKTNFERSIVCRDVDFSYLHEMPVLQGISLEIARGEAVAIVGPSGAGKSTLVDMVMRFYDVDSGSILIDGIDIRRLRIADLRRLIGLVTQEVILFNDTVRNNIAYGLEAMPMEKVVEAAVCANAHGFIEALDEGYETCLGDRGTRLSGGQRQRISIARAILKNPEILIFDEATSSLDTESELLVQQAIERLMENRTSLVIAHRLSTIQHCDRIIVLNEGRIVQTGTHEELLTADGLYKRLYELQFQPTGSVNKK
ncbi:MAG: ABC transporter ATP-binding protein [Candidatus Glassbacteria bacterium]|nr:ABC transporter ATP-binding protein [Candidatus Glassbacteria bacterium]